MSQLFKSAGRKLGVRVKPKSQTKPQTKTPQAATEATKELLITGLSQDGRGVARQQGKTVFVAGGLPGERVTVMHYRKHKRFDECQVRSVTEPSTERTEPKCPHFSECGGCQLQHLDAAAQIVYKQSAVLEQLQRQVSIVPEHIVDPITSPAQGYRARARVAVSKTGQLAFRQGASDSLVPITSCLVQDPRLQQLLAPLQQWLDTLAKPLKGSRKSVAVTHVELIAADSGLGVVMRHPHPVPAESRQELSILLAPLAADVWWQAEKHGSLEASDGSACEPSLSYQLQGFDLELSFQPANFTQVNSQVNQAMVARAIEWLALEAGDQVADLFCGIGNFTLPMALKAKRVVGIEAIDDMVLQGRLNAEAQALDNVEFQALNLAQEGLGMRLQGLGVNKLLLDPPRSGAKEVCEVMHRTGAQSLVYVSCNPASLARDAAILERQGYRLTKFCVLDMFPHTAHVESMALFLKVD